MAIFTPYRNNLKCPNCGGEKIRKLTKREDRSRLLWTCKECNHKAMLNKFYKVEK